MKNLRKVVLVVDNVLELLLGKDLPNPRDDITINTGN